MLDRERKHDAVVTLGGDRGEQRSRSTGGTGLRGSARHGADRVVHEGAAGGLAVVGAAGVVVAERDVDRHLWKGEPQLHAHESDCFGSKGGEIRGCGAGVELFKAARELMCEQIAAEGDKEGVLLGIPGCPERRFEQIPIGVKARRAAGDLELGETGVGFEAVAAIQDSGPALDGGGAQLWDKARIVEGIEVNVRQKERGNGL